jgi:hypothetical protein
MKKLMISLAAITAIGAAVPAAAQTWTYGGPRYVQPWNDYYNHVNRDLLSMSRRINTAEGHHQISRAEAQSLRQEVRSVAARMNRLGRNGLDSREAARLTARLQRVAVRMDQFRYTPPYRYAYQSAPGYYVRDWND